MSNEAKEILDRYWDLLLPVKVDDIANRCGICIRHWMNLYAKISVAWLL